MLQFNQSGYSDRNQRAAERIGEHRRNQEGQQVTVQSGPIQTLAR